MTPRRKMLEELERLNYSEGKVRRYLRFVERFCAALRQVTRQARSRSMFAATRLACSR